MKAVDSNVNLPEVEQGILGFWEKNQTFYKSNEQRRSAPEFSFYDGPPFANGLPHYGHLLANTIKDTVPRYWNMRGYYVERRFGWDTHGVPVEFEIEKREKLKGRQDILNIGVDRFNEMCRESVLHYAGHWQKTITRLGRWVDWNNQYKTMDRTFMESVWWVFHTLYEKGLVYQGHKVVPYSPRITAVLSNFEANQNYQDVQDPAITVKFKLANEDAYILAWTTTPWTLISNLALAVGPEIDYVKIRAAENNEIYYLAKARLDHVFKKSKKKTEPDYEILSELKGRDLSGRSYQPLFSYFKDHANSFRILLDDYVTTEEGTGVVHMAPAYGEDDFRVCTAAGIELIDPLDEEGCFREQIAEYKSLFVKDADKEIIKDLKANHMLLRHETLVHSYPMCERTNTPLIYRAIPSWYVAVEKIKDQLVANNQKIHWVPEHLKNGRMGKWLENARDWAISRNRFWGTPLPIWICDKNDQHIECIGSVAALEEKTSTKIDDLHKHHIDELAFDCPQCGGKMRRISEVFDCWFESGSMPYAQLHYPFENKERFETAFPADFIAEGLDQTRGWFYTLSVLSTALFDRPAFKNVVVNGLVLAEDGRKMSKRWQNYTPPEELINSYGADSVRLYMLNSAILRGEDLRFSNDGVKDTTRAVILPLWNAFSFLSTYAQADGWQPDASLATGQIPKSDQEMDRWLVSRLHTLIAGVHKEMESYTLYNVVPRLIDFIGDLTNWYIRLSRRKFWAGEEGMSQVTRQAYETLFYVLCEYTKIFAPFAPFTSERIYQGLTEGLAGVPNSVHLCDAPLSQESAIDAALEEKMNLIRRVTELGRSLRAKHQLKTRQVLPGMLVITRKPQDRQYIEDGSELLRSELNLKTIDFTNEETKYVNLSVKPNLRTLGKRLGKDMREFQKFLAELSQDPEKVATFLSDLEQNSKTSWQSYDLGLEDFLIDRSPMDDRLIATESGVTILLDTTLTDELIIEGLAREIVNRIQNFRKDSGLQVTDRIALQIAAAGQLEAAVKNHGDYIAAETLAESLELRAQAAIKSDLNQSYQIGEDECVIGMTRITS
ncbi:MAG: isoleucine--tRNA ligase [Oligoflexus sp.]